MPINLDELKNIRTVDTQDMLSRIADFPNQLEKAWNDVLNMVLPSYYLTCSKVVICGMGGSGIGGELAKIITDQDSRIPVFIHKNYGIPNIVDAKTLVIAISYSGNTEETLDAFVTAKQRGAKLFAITTGGELEKLASKYRAPMYKFNYVAQPRAALGYLFGSCLAILKKAGLVDTTAKDMNKTLEILKSFNESLYPDSALKKNLAKKIARDLEGYLPIIFTSPILETAGFRWKAQLNENAKNFSYSENYPELDHNAISGLDYPGLADKIYVLTLQSNHDIERIGQRQEISNNILDQKAIAHDEIKLDKNLDLLTEILEMALLGDYTSYYLAAINGIDPTSIPQVTFLKDKLKEKTA